MGDQERFLFDGARCAGYRIYSRHLPDHIRIEVTATQALIPIKLEDGRIMEVPGRLSIIGKLWGNVKEIDSPQLHDGRPFDLVVYAYDPNTRQDRMFSLDNVCIVEFHEKSGWARFTAGSQVTWTGKSVMQELQDFRNDEGIKPPEEPPAWARRLTDSVLERTRKEDWTAALSALLKLQGEVLKRLRREDDCEPEG